MTTPTWRLFRAEMTLSLREKAGPLWGVGFPVVLLVILGSIPSFRTPGEDGRAVIDVYVPVMVLFALAILALTALPMVLAGYRENGVLRRMRTTPVGPARVLAAQLGANFAIALVAMVIFLAVGRIAFGVRLPAHLAGFAVTWLLAAAALLSIGLLLTAVAPNRNTATAIGTVLFFPLMFFAGLWLPVTEMPPPLREISHYTPLGAGVRALLQSSFDGDFPSAQPLLTLVAYAVVCTALSVRLFRWE